MSTASVAALLAFVVVFGLLCLWLLWERFGLPGSIMWRARRSSERETERLSRLPAADLVAEARKAIRSEQWERFGAARALLDKDDWTHESLLAQLDDLYRALFADDEATGHQGRGGCVFEFYDCGLAMIGEALQKRRAVTNPT